MTDITLTVFIVEDSYDDVQVLTTALTYHHITVHAVKNIRELRALLPDVVPDVVITDLAMPEDNGWAVLDAIRRNPTTTHIPVVAMTAYHSTKLANDIAKAGFDGYFPKPIDFQNLVTGLIKLVIG